MFELFEGERPHLEKVTCENCREETYITYREWLANGESDSGYFCCEYCRMQYEERKKEAEEYAKRQREYFETHPKEYHEYLEEMNRRERKEKRSNFISYVAATLITLAIILGPILLIRSCMIRHGW